MRIQYFYQQMLAFLAVTMTILILLGFFFLQFARNSAYQETEDQLFAYADSFIDTGLQLNRLESGQRILGNLGVSIGVFNQESIMTFPITNRIYQSTLSEENLAELQNGEHISLTVQQTDFFGNNVQTALVYQPFFEEGTGDYLGHIAVSAPISNIEERLAEVRENLYIAFIFSSLGAAVISFLFAKYQVTRINKLRDAAHKVSEGNFEIMLKNQGRDEFDDLAGDFSLMVESLKASQEEIERQENRRRQFMADAAHEMRTPLTTINGLLEGMEYDMIPENQKKRSVQLMQNETRRLIRLVNENLDYEKIRSNQIVLRKQTFNAQEALEMIAGQLDARAAEAGNKLLIEVSKELTVYADYDRFVQILVNIIQNAIQFTKNGTILVSGKRGQNESIFVIQDTGIGMTAEEVQNIWERYYKADISRKNTKYGESGLGLAIVQQLMNLHGATVTVESTSGEGTTFRLVFPDKEMAAEG